MALYYLDTSALVKRYAAETGTAWVTALIDPTAEHEITTIRLSGPELIAALALKVRIGQLAPEAAARASRNFRVDWQTRYLVVEVTPAVADRASGCCPGASGRSALARIALADLRLG